MYVPSVVGVEKDGVWLGLKEWEVGFAAWKARTERFRDTGYSRWNA